MNVLFYMGETAVSYAFPQAGAALTTIRYAHTAYNVVKASASLFSGEYLSGGISIASMGVSCLTGEGGVIGSIASSAGRINPEYIRCINDCHRTCGVTWTLAMCITGCDRFR